jgi:hypothetical protein
VRRNPDVFVFFNGESGSSSKEASRFADINNNNTINTGSSLQITHVSPGTEWNKLIAQDYSDAEPMNTCPSVPNYQSQNQARSIITGEVCPVQMNRHLTQDLDGDLSIG